MPRSASQGRWRSCRRLWSASAAPSASSRRARRLCCARSKRSARWWRATRRRSQRSTARSTRLGTKRPCYARRSSTSGFLRLAPAATSPLAFATPTWSSIRCARARLHRPRCCIASLRRSSGRAREPRSNRRSQQRGRCRRTESSTRSGCATAHDSTTGAA